MATNDSPLSVAALRELALDLEDVAPPSGDLPEANLVVDTFETANMTPTLNNSGFSWGANNRTSVVTMDPGPVAVWNNGAINNPDADQSKDWSAKEGSHCLRFRFDENPGAIGTGETLAEQRWGMTDPQSDLWIGYWMRVPVNYYNDPANANSKFMSVWMDEYTSIGPGAVWNLRPTASGGASFRLSVATPTQQPSVPGGENTIYNDLIRVPQDRGKWFYFAYRIFQSTSGSSNDGRIETYFMREGESSITQCATLQNLNISYKGSGPNGWRAGFLLGSHRGYAEATEFFVDKFTLSSEVLI